MGNSNASHTRKWYVAWGMVIALALMVGGLAIQQTFFNTATAETSYSSAENIWSDPRDPCVPVPDEKGQGRGYLCTKNPKVSPRETMRFYAGQCKKAGSVSQGVVVDLPVGSLNRIDPVLSRPDRDGWGSILVTYRPKVFGLFGGNRVVKVEATPQGHPCAHGTY